MSLRMIMSVWVELGTLLESREASNKPISMGRMPLSMIMIQFHKFLEVEWVEMMIT